MLNYKYWLIILYGGILVLIGCKHETVSVNEVKDFDGNIYHTVKIGRQTWMVENLMTTHFRNGDRIMTENDKNWFSDSSSYFLYNYSVSNTKEYGCLYNWEAVNDNRNICPKGWHIPSLYEWQELDNYLGGSSISGNKLREANGLHWERDTLGTNSSGFTALAGGIHDESFYNDIKICGYWWSSTPFNSQQAWFFELVTNMESTFYNYYPIHFGLSVRCIRDSI